MTRVEFENYISRIKVCLQVFEEQNKNNISTCLYLSDEHKRLFYSINFYNVAHLLGVNTAIIKEKCNLNKIMGSYEVLKYLIKNSYYVYHKCFEEGNSVSPFSSFINEKLAAFCKNLYPNFKDIDAVIEFDKEKTYLSEYSNELMDIDYFILKRRDNTIFLLGLRRKDNKKDNYDPVTSMEITARNVDFLKKYLWKQNWYYVGCLEVKDGYTTVEKYSLTYKERSKKIQNLCFYREKFCSSICVADDCVAAYRTFNVLCDQLNEYRNYINWLIAKLRKKFKDSIPDFSFTNLKKYDQNLLLKLNDTIDKYFLVGYKSDLQSLNLHAKNSELSLENEKLRNELEEQKRNLEQQRQVNQELEKENTELSLKLERIDLILQEKIDK